MNPQEAPEVFVWSLYTCTYMWTCTSYQAPHTYTITHGCMNVYSPGIGLSLIPKYNPSLCSSGCNLLQSPS